MLILLCSEACKPWSDGQGAAGSSLGRWGCCLVLLRLQLGICVNDDCTVSFMTIHLLLLLFQQQRLKFMLADCSCCIKHWCCSTEKL
jgi:hypothetical protein